MRSTLLALLIVLSCCGGCKTRTTKDEGGNTVGKSKTIWFWQKDYGGQK
jgi:hypothetical protein